jgi:hypothetical protein
MCCVTSPVMSGLRWSPPPLCGSEADRPDRRPGPPPVGVVIASVLASQLVARIGPRPLIVAGSAMVAGGMFWFSRLTEHAGYASHLLGPQPVSSFGLGLVFVPLALVALHTTWPSGTPVSPPACSTPPSRSAARSGSRCSAPSPGRPSRTASGLRSRTRRRPPRRRASHCRSRASPACVHLRSGLDGRLFPCVPGCRGNWAARPAHCDRHYPSQPPGTGRCRARVARGGITARGTAARDCAAA